MHITVSDEAQNFVLQLNRMKY